MQKRKATTVKLSVTVLRDTRKRVEARAKLESRSVSNMVDVLLLRGLDKTKGA